MAERALTVLQMLPALEGGGVEQGALEISEALLRAGHHSLVMSAGGRMVAALENAGGEHITWPVDRKRPWTLRLIRPLQRLLVERQVDVLHLRSRMPAWIGWLAWRGLPADQRPRLVTTVHGFYSVNRYSAIMTRGERVIAVSESIRDYVLSAYPATDPGRVSVIHRGVDPQRFNPSFRPAPDWLATWRSSLGAKPEASIITLIGRLTRLKGHEPFLALIKALEKRGVHGVVVGGEHPGRRRYAESIRDAAIGMPVSFTGHRSDVREIMAASDLVVSLSTQPESFGRTVLEALSLGTPVAGYDHGGVGEILSALYPAGRVPLGDDAALVERAGALLDAPPAPPASHPFSLRNMQDATLDLYDELLADRPAG